MEIELKDLNPEGTLAMADAMAILYSSDFIDSPDRETPFYSQERFHERINNYVKLPGYQAIAAISGTELVGFIYGSTVRANGPWWKALVTPLPDDVTAEDGKRTLAIYDLLVARAWRGHGIASRLHANLLKGRKEERITLLSSEPQQPAYTIWLHWGYEIVAKAQPAPNGPVLDVFLRSLPRS